ncbi:1-aminocyclopropane-1-carboxylate deaminase/D-cysteine desulfhydrase [Alkalimonas amylolytica]|uniref:1-aminocyclopropane-1-carboxylate deaminase n=1 Tax=Alkalimonas amylolytica TaxID=152573 RepID=A0A1H4FU24_ALKAM|nr:pyridoxal-phosphate dependent enzyme [Alkalimonas amylolytica]SEB00320.1 1-aminocyclopropane-1-carboxylate deaminase [Alkalimonas amylolytica]
MMNKKPANNWQQICDPLFDRHQLRLWLYQAAQPFDALSGNKQLKLHYPLKMAQKQGQKGILTFGGAFSNHLAATAIACEQLSMASIGLVRTDQLDTENPTLQQCHASGMQLLPLSRTEYRLRNHPDWLAQLQQQYPDFVIVPEGGSSELGVQGVSELNLTSTPDGNSQFIVSASGSGGTIAGLALGNPNAQVVGIAVVKDVTLQQKVKHFCQQANNWQLITGYTGKGYGRFDAKLLQFCLDFRQRHQITLEPVYTGKAMSALYQLIAAGIFPRGSTLTFFHTGGLQGLAGLRYRGLIAEADYKALTASD